MHNGKHCYPVKTLIFNQHRTTSNSDTGRGGADHSPEKVSSWSLQEINDINESTFASSLNNFYARYEDDTEKANDKKAAQLRNKVKALTLVVR